MHSSTGTPCPAVTAIVPPRDLTAREVDLLSLVVRGLGTDAIAAELGLTPRTVRNYLGDMYRKLGVDSRVGLLLWWARAHDCCLFADRPQVLR